MMKIEKMRKITGRAVMAAVLAVVLCLAAVHERCGGALYHGSGDNADQICGG